MGLHMNPDNRWIKMADAIPWDMFEKKYSRLFKVKTGNVAKPLRTALGALIIQTKFQYSGRELVEQITENPYLQYFIGLPGYQDEPLFDPSTMVFFRKRINAQMIAEANDYMLSNLNKKNDGDEFAKCKKRTMKKIRKALRQQLAYVRRDIGYLDDFMSDEYAPEPKEIPLLLTIYKLYGQQCYMYENKVHSVEK